MDCWVNLRDGLRDPRLFTLVFLEVLFNYLRFDALILGRNRRWDAISILSKLIIYLV